MSGLMPCQSTKDLVNADIEVSRAGSGGKGLGSRSAIRHVAAFRYLYLIMSFSQTVATARNKKGLTQEELAGLANVTVRTIQRIESGETIPRAYTLKAIAAALDISFEELQSGTVNLQQPVNASLNAATQVQKEDAVHFLQLLCLSCFSYLVIPFVHFLIPNYILKKRKEQNQVVVAYARRVIRNQIYWMAGLILLFLFTVAYNALCSVYFDRQYIISYLVPFFVMYFLNAVIIIKATLAAKKIHPTNN